MHRPPATRYRVTRSRWFAAILLAFWLLATLNILLFAWQQDRLPWVLALLAGCLALGLWAAVGWMRSPTGELRWDGEHLFWSDQPEALTQVQLVLDAGRLVMARFYRPGGASLFLVLTDDKTQDWLALRRVLVALAAPPRT